MINMPTKKELMQKLNKLLGTNHNWSRLNKLDLERLVDGIEEEKGEKSAIFA